MHKKFSPSGEGNDLIEVLYNSRDHGTIIPTTIRPPAKRRAISNRRRAVQNQSMQLRKDKNVEKEW
jgi:hypothetical protein